MKTATLGRALHLGVIVVLLLVGGVARAQQWGAMPAVEGKNAVAAAELIRQSLSTAKIIYLNREFNETLGTEKSIVAWQYPAAGAMIDANETVALVVEYKPLKAMIVSDAATRPKIVPDWLGADPKSVNWLRKSCRLIYSMAPLSPAQINSGAYRIVATYPAPYDPIDPASVVGAIVVPMEVIVPPVSSLQPLYWPTLEGRIALSLGFVNFITLIVIAVIIRRRGKT